MRVQVRLLLLLRLMVMVKVVVTGVPAASHWRGMVEHVLHVRTALEIDGATGATNGATVLSTDANAASIADGAQRDCIRGNSLRRLEVTGRTVLVRALGALVWRC